MPRNIQDFKDHPAYALERHLRSNEVIHPMRESGKLSVGKAANAVEPIFRRSDVHIVKSATKWYREGRDIKVCPLSIHDRKFHRANVVKRGEQPLKIGRKQRGGRSLSAEKDASDEDETSAGLYASFQTDLYVPPVVVRGKIPKNAFGNLDVYVPSMIPSGAVHIRCTDAANAARIVRVDCADAVVGFKFKGRQGTAVVKGVVVAKEYRAAVEEVVEALRYQRHQAESQKKAQGLLTIWKRFLLGLKIRERVMGHGLEAEHADLKEEIDHAEDAEEKKKREGGFFLDKNLSTAVQPTSRGDFGGGSLLHEPDELGLGVFDADDQSVKRDYFQPTIVSPWDFPGRVSNGQKPSVESQSVEKAKSPDLEGLFEKHDDGEGVGGFFRESLSNSRNAPRRDHGNYEDSAGGFFQEDLPISLNKNDANGLTGGFARNHGDEEPFRDVDSRPFDYGRDGANHRYSTLQEDDQKAQTFSHNAGNGSIQGQRQEPPLDSETTDRNAEEAVLEKQLRTANVSHTSMAAEIALQEPQEVAEAAKSDDSLDQASLLSHDPEDEEAEPEWLVDEASL